MRASIVILLLMTAAVRADGPDLLVAISGKTTRMRLKVEAEGFAPETVWGAFLDKMFDYFDRDADGSLNFTEVARIFPLPLPDGKSAKADFAAMDANRDAKVSRDEFKTYYRRSGFTPIIITVVPPSSESARLHETLFRLLDRDGAGQLTAEKLRRAPELLHRLDENEDDALSMVEVLAFPLANPPHSGRLITVVASDSTMNHSTIRMNVFADHRKPTLTLMGAELPKAMSGAFVISATESPIDFAATRQFYLSALGGRDSINRKEIDEGFSLLQPLFDAADRNGDGKLTVGELTAFLALIETGVGCQTFVTITECGQNLFQLMDENGDGRLDLAELNRAARLLPAGSWTRADVPARFPIAIVRGRSSGSFGPILLASRSKSKTGTAVVAVRGPRWFQAMDRNGDGFVSAAEFQGPPDLFRRLDLDGDGRISVEEAEKADVAMSRRLMP